MTDCYTYQIVNTGEGNLFYSYIPCGSNTATGGVLAADQTTEVCACNGSVSIVSGSGTITQLAECSV